MADRGRRFGAPLVAVAAGLGMTIVPVPPPAQAGTVAIVTAVNQAGVNFSDNGIADCTVSSPGDTSSALFTANGAVSNRSVSSTSTITDDSNPSDVTTATGSAKSVVTATVPNGQLTLDWGGTVKAKLVVAQGPASDCDAEADSTAANSLQFTVAQPSWMVIDGEVPRGLIGQMILMRISPALPPYQQIVILVGTHAHAHSEVLLAPGTYSAIMVAATQLEAPDSPGDPTSVAYDFDIDSAFIPAGTATAKASGPAGHFVSLAGVLSCPGDSLEATWKSAAGKGNSRKVAKATFYVDGDKTKTVKNPDKGDKTKLKSLDTSETVDVRAKLKLVSGEVQTVSRSYLACS